VVCNTLEWSVIHLSGLSLSLLRRFCSQSVDGFFYYRYGLDDDVRKSLYGSVNDWLDAVGSRQFMGGDSPNLADLVGHRVAIPPSLPALTSDLIPDQNAVAILGLLAYIITGIYSEMGPLACESLGQFPVHPLTCRVCHYAGVCWVVNFSTVSAIWVQLSSLVAGCLWSVMLHRGMSGVCRPDQ